MSASWHISLGYDSNTEIDWQRLRAIAIQLATEDTSTVSRTALADGAPERDEDGTSIRGYAEKLRCEALCADRGVPPSDLTFVIMAEDEAPEARYISLSASGGGASREIKNYLRRAFCFQVLARANQMGINVNINVV